MREVDRLMVEELQIELLQMVGNAGRALAEQARRQLGGDVRNARVGVLAGRGGDGGGGLTAARRFRSGVLMFRSFWARPTRNFTASRCAPRRVRQQPS